MSESASASADKYADYSREQLLAEINRLKKNKKYGLVWEHKKEQVIEDFETQQPYLQEVAEKRIENAPGEPTNLIIEGDNFEALSILNYTHAGKVDVIYIDPPYNTGNKDFIYNDNYVDSEDEFRHSKWLSFMEPRLKLAKNLLKDDGVIFISIDDNEQANLKVLCDYVFGSELFISSMIWRKQGGGKSDSKYLANNTEYILCYGKEKTEKFRTKEADASIYNKEDENGKKYRLMSLDFGSLSYHKSLDYPITLPNGYVCYPGGDKDKWELRQSGKYSSKDWTWRCSENEYKKRLDEGRIEYTYNKKSKKWKVQERLYLDNREGGLHENLITDFTNRTANNEIQSIFGDRAFAYPKPSVLISFLVSLIRKTDVVVLDFFAGSGTTGHAVLDLNKKDGGHRQFILCTNNGDKGPDSVKIAEDITYPRIKTVITGKRQDGSKYSDGIPANLRYYKIEHKEKRASIDANRLEIVRYLEDIIQVKENTFEQIEVNEDFALYKNSERFVGMVFEPFALEEIIESIKEKNSENKPVKLYVFSYSRDAFEDNFGTDFEIEFVAMPEGLLKTYANIVAETKKEDA